MNEHLVVGKVLTVWINQVMYPGVITSVSDSSISLDSIQYKGMSYAVNRSSITAITLDSSNDTLEKLEANQKAHDEKQKAMADAMREAAEQAESKA